MNLRLHSRLGEKLVSTNRRRGRRAARMWVVGFYNADSRMSASKRP